ncbi:MAG: glycosyltransferase family 2 protein [Pseudomonadota bacterium]|nr:glycosyltransferase family 2 protein [Pseudomonadota bacterium]
MTTPLLSIVVPCYNEEGSIAALAARLDAVLGDYKTQGTEILLVDDGSADGTWPAIEKLCAKDAGVIGVRLSRNFGHQMALACGLDHARGRRVLVIDADLQDPPELLPAMIKKMDEGFDVVYGKRRSRQGEGGFKKASAWVYYRLLGRLSEVPIPPEAGDFRLMSRRAVDALIALPERIRFTRGLVAWLGFRQAAVEYTREARHAGETHYPLRAMLRFANEGITSFSTRPLQLATWLGLLMMMVSIGLLGYVFLSWLLFDTVRGWTSLAAIFLLSQAAQWLMLGIIGNYLAVMFREVKARPLYLIDRTLNR